MGLDQIEIPFHIYLPMWKILVYMGVEMKTIEPTMITGFVREYISGRKYTISFRIEVSSIVLYKNQYQIKSQPPSLYLVEGRSSIPTRY